MRRNTILALALVALMLAAMAAKSLLVSVPPLRAQNDAAQFDASAARTRLARVLGDERPHPADSPAGDAVRQRLIAELRGLGLQPVVRDQLACNDFQRARLVACARVRNVIAVLGPGAGKALLLNAHYDSVPVGPGAGDDGVGVATLLEVAAKLRTQPLRRPVILLFNEGEELGLVGARAFLADPLSRGVDSVLNFEARGVTGPVTMFETSQPNGAAVAVFAGAARRPFASSLMTDVYRLMPNDTDVTAFSERGWLTLNFAITGNETRYHSPGDTLAALDPRSLQHMGDQALAVAGELAAGMPAGRSQRIFVDVLGRGLLQMPLALGLALFAVLLLSFSVLALRRRAHRRALASVALAFAGAAAAGWATTVLLGLLRAGNYWRAHQELTFIAIYAAALLAILAAVAGAGRGLRPGQLRAAFWAFFLLLGGAIAIAAPGAVIYFLAPPLVALAGAAASRWSARAETVGGLAALLILYLSWGEMLALLEELFSPGPLWIVAPVAALVMIPATIEAQPIIAAASRRALLLGSATLAIAAFAIAAAAPAYSADRQQRFTIEHVTRFPSRVAQWSLLTDGAPLPDRIAAAGHWTRGKLPFSERLRWLSPAPAVAALQAPSMTLVETVSHPRERTIRLRLHTAGAERLTIVIPEEARVRRAGFTGFERALGSSDSSGRFTISCTGRSCDGAELTVQQATTRPTVWTLVAARNGLPPSAQPIVAARPRFARPQYVPDETVAVATLRI